MDFHAAQYEESFIDRPHISWAWNQLCHPNGHGSWEESPIAILEPLSEVPNVIGCCPDDTLTMGPHRLSKQSIILVPKKFATLIRKKLIEEGNFQGQVHTYPPSITLRQAIANKISEQFPQSIKLANFKGEEVSTLNLTRENSYDHDYIFEQGQFTFLYQLFPNGQKRKFITSISSEVEYQPFAEYAKGRHLGNHHDFYTDIERKNNILKNLINLSQNLADRKQYWQYLLSRIDYQDAEQKFLYQALEKYFNLKRYNGGEDYGLYLLKKVLIAELYESSSVSKTERFHQRVEQTLTQLLEQLSTVKGLTKTNDEGHISLVKSNFPLKTCQNLIHGQQFKPTEQQRLHEKIHSNQIKFNQLLDKFKMKVNELTEIEREKSPNNIKYKKAEGAAKILIVDLKIASTQFFTSDEISHSTFVVFKDNCKKAIKRAKQEFKKHNGWYALDPLLRCLLGVIATLAIIPALLVHATTKNGYSGTFFKTPKTKYSENLDFFQDNLKKNILKGLEVEFYPIKSNDFR